MNTNIHISNSPEEHLLVIAATTILVDNINSLIFNSSSFPGKEGYLSAIFITQQLHMAIAKT